MAHIAPGVILAIFASFFYMRYIFRVKREPTQPLDREINIWKRTLNRLKRENEEEETVARKLEVFIDTLEKTKTEAPQELKEVDITELEKKYIIRDINLFIVCSIVICCVIVLFFLHSMVEIHLNLAWIAIIGSMYYFKFILFLFLFFFYIYYFLLFILNLF